MDGQSPARSPDGPIFSLVFPAYNPGPAVERTVRAVEEFLAESPDWEVLFVCDGCTDGTALRLADHARRRPDRVRVLVHAPNRGKGYAVRRGLEAARGRWRLFTDVDLAYSFDDVRRLAAALAGGAEVAIASRLHPDSRFIVPPSLQGYAYRRYLQSVVFSALVRQLLPVRERDTQAGLKGLSARTASLLLPHLRCDGFAFDCELLAACSVLGVPVTEVPVRVRYEDGASTTSAHSTGRMLRALGAIRRDWGSAARPAAVRARQGVSAAGAERRAA
jgi:glycosyltransferase involved in cell wall biosynthesis